MWRQPVGDVCVGVCVCVRSHQFHPAPPPLFFTHPRPPQVLGFLQESLDTVEVPPEPPEQAGRALYERLSISKLREEIALRVTDLKKNLNGSRRELEVRPESWLATKGGGVVRGAARGLTAPSPGTGANWGRGHRADDAGRTGGRC